MKRLKVPFMDKIFEKNSDAIRDENGETTWQAQQDIVGVRTGIQLTPRDDNNQYTKFSGVTSAFANFPLAIFKLSERYFLQAEAALRWNIGGSVNTNYLRGVAAMFDDYDIAQTEPDFQTYWNQESADQECTEIKRASFRIDRVDWR